MASKKRIVMDENAEKDMLSFLNKLESDMFFDSSFTGDLLAFEWVDMIEDACPYIDLIVRNPKVALIKEENVVLIEKSKKIDVTSVKDLAKHTERINKYDRRTDSVEPKKILDIRNEETFNTYENRFLYTVVKMTIKFVHKKERLLKKFELKDNKVLEYSSKTRTTSDKVNIELKITSETIPNDDVDNNIMNRIKEIKKRIKRIKEYLASWERSPMIKELDAARVHLMEPPIRKTNVILKNPNFQVAVKLWEYLYKYDLEEREAEEESLDGKGGNVLLGFLDHAFLIDYFVMNSFATSKREQKSKMAGYALLLLTEEIRRIMELLKSAGFNLSEEDLLKMIAKELKKDHERLVGVDDVKKKFKSAMSEYLERTQDYL